MTSDLLTVTDLVLSILLMQVFIVQPELLSSMLQPSAFSFASVAAFRAAVCAFNSATSASAFLLLLSHPTRTVHSKRQHRVRGTTSSNLRDDCPEIYGKRAATSVSGVTGQSDSKDYAKPGGSGHSATHFRLHNP